MADKISFDEIAKQYEKKFGEQITFPIFGVELDDFISVIEKHINDGIPYTGEEFGLDGSKLV
ncbi:MULTISPECIES: hypothetical protein [unclassified Breznakia]|uniref:hypothetical protein n=1 Tax=unclassified Breznakia TaxID=2623764 RepID=UPI002474EAE8|nr:MULTISPECIES: hypothetical protein [unclassified Breznakia]MDH6367548.1 hypothetical protein [Breznakia sp. PH1-1]MDH6404658.1 hypothetical protein [Breznakia sp. PF1-11]MDH6412378.1 hypothetical protein [Breznakia sp. PFB1-11]MDH6414716.1 hypothetical protein [Breznakia sp. PFB1-14]MDH6417039.1 hypothetical protein [Breznakia sp. PFB1-4]